MLNLACLSGQVTPPHSNVEQHFGHVDHAVVIDTFGYGFNDNNVMHPHNGYYHAFKELNNSTK